MTNPSARAHIERYARSPRHRMVLYLRISDDLKAEIVRIAERANVPVNFVAEILLRRGLGDSWAPGTTAVERLEAVLDGRS